MTLCVYVCVFSTIGFGVRIPPFFFGILPSSFAVCGFWVELILIPVPEVSI